MNCGVLECLLECGRLDLNQHRIAPTSTSSLRVYHSTTAAINRTIIFNCRFSCNRWGAIEWGVAYDPRYGTRRIDCCNINNMFLYNLIFKPIEIIIDFAYVFSRHIFPLIGALGNVFFVSIIVNLIALPLYNKAEKLQKIEKDKVTLLKPGVDHIKKAFKGNERFMMLNEYYRQNSYHPLYALRSSLSILIEIPIFIAAYRYLSEILPFEDGWLWLFGMNIISDVGTPDGLLKIQDISINVLPIVMTIINFISVYIYTKNSTLREKLQVYVLGLIFLVLLYNSPSGLVFYWILNNVFSLVRNIVMTRSKEPKKWLLMYISAIIVLIGLLMVLTYINVQMTIPYGLTYGRVVLIIGIVLAIISALYKTKYGNFIFNKTNELTVPIVHRIKNILTFETSKGLFLSMVLSGVCLTILYGFVVPSSTIATSPIEFSFIGKTDSPMNYIYNALSVFAGVFVVWPFLIYKMFDVRVRKVLSVLLFTLFITSLFNIFVFKSDYGLINEQFFLENDEALKHVGFVNAVLPFVVTILAFCLFLLLVAKNKLSFVILLEIAILITGVIIGSKNSIYINKIYKEYKDDRDIINKGIGGLPQIKLSKTQKNVIFFFLDAAMGELFPYVLKDNPSLNDSFSGFVYYPNTISFFRSTIGGAPAILGGYEYTPESMNKRNNELLHDKHNEATLIMPTLFNKAGYRNFITDMPYPNYQWLGDYSKFKDLTNTITCDLSQDKRLQNVYIKEVLGGTDTSFDKVTAKGTINFSLLQAIYPIFRYFFNICLRSYTFDVASSFNIPNSKNVQKAIQNLSPIFMLPRLTEFDNENGTYLFFGSSITHDPSFVKDDNITIIGRDGFYSEFYPYTSELEQSYYSVNRAGLYLVGQYLDYLKENDVYDNTRIIIVADHGRNVKSANSIVSKNNFLPLFLVKDFNSNGDVITDSTFMTNADAPLFALKDICNPLINPFTNNQMKAEKGMPIRIYNTSSEERNPMQLDTRKATKFKLTNGGYTVIPGDVNDDANWIPIDVD